MPAIKITYEEFLEWMNEAQHVEWVNGTASIGLLR